MAPREIAEHRHFNPLLINFLPKERRARNAYQFCTMCTAISYGVMNLWLGVLPGSSIGLLSPDARLMFNVWCITAGVLGIFAAIVPERVISTWRIVPVRRFGEDGVPRWSLQRAEIDWTWFRLWEELACHVLLITVWVSLGIAALDVWGAQRAWAFTVVFAFWFTIAALWRAVQIALTLKHTMFDTPAPSVLMSANVIPNGDKKKNPASGIDSESHG